MHEDPSPAPYRVTIREAADMTGVTEKALRRRIERGTLTSVRVGDQRLLEVTELVRANLFDPWNLPVDRELKTDAETTAHPRSVPHGSPAGEPALTAELSSLPARFSSLLDVILLQGVAIRDLTARVEDLERDAR